MESFIRNKSNLLEDEDLRLMAFSWECGDFHTEKSNIDKFNIYIFGVDHNSRSVCLSVKNFTPYFYVKVKEDFCEPDLAEFKHRIKQTMYKNKDHLISAKICLKKDINGFNNGKLFKYVRLVFDNERIMRNVSWVLSKQPPEGLTKYTIYDNKSGPMLTFGYIQDIMTCGWIEVKRQNLKEHHESRCQLNYSVDWKFVNPLDRHDIAQFVTLSFDIECYSHDGFFPDPVVPENTITQIGSGFCKQNSDEVIKHVIVLGECDPVEGAILDWYETEEEVITAWVELIEKTDPDLIIGYNIKSFDWYYIWERAQFLEIEDIVKRLSRLTKIPSTFKDDTMQSQAYGILYFKYINIPGVNQLDLMHWFRKNKKLVSYKLDDVSFEYLQTNKHPVSVKEIFEMSGPRGNPKGRAIVAAYCCQDTFLPIKLMYKFNMIINMIEMAKLTRIPFMYLVLRGETIKVHSQIAYTARKENFLIPTVDGIENENDESFVGATVLKPKIGSYNMPISGLDFASLYPSIMIAHNLCPTTFVKNDKYDNLSGIEYSHFKWDTGDYKFVKNVEGLVPGILKKLWSERKKVKKEMDSAGLLAKNLEKENKIEEAKKWKNSEIVLNGKQLAIKLSMNSIYGAFGSSYFSMSCKPIGATVTYNGRCMIEQSKQIAETTYNGSVESRGIKADVIYGDSVTGICPIVINKNNKLIVKKIEDIVETEWLPYNQFKPSVEGLSQKEQSTVDGKIMTANGWSSIVRVIRHKTNKKIFKVKTNKGIVFVTEDHSLLRENGEQVKPGELKLGEKLMHRNIICN